MATRAKSQDSGSKNNIACHRKKYPEKQNLTLKIFKICEFSQCFHAQMIRDPMFVSKTENRSRMKIFSESEKSGCFNFYNIFMAFSVRRQKKGTGKY